MLSVFALVFACKLTYSLSLALALAKGPSFDLALWFLYSQIKYDWQL